MLLVDPPVHVECHRCRVGYLFQSHPRALHAFWRLISSTSSTQPHVNNTTTITTTAMLPFRIAAPQACILTSSIHSAPFTRATRAHLPRLRLLLQHRQPQRRCLASSQPSTAGTTPGKVSGPELQGQARAAAQNPKQYGTFSCRRGSVMPATATPHVPR